MLILDEAIDGIAWQLVLPVVIDLISILDSCGFRIEQESARPVRSHGDLTMWWGSLQVSDDIAHTRNLVWGGTEFRAIDIQAIVFCADIKLVLPDSQAAQRSPLRHLVGYHIRAILARFGHIAVEGIAAQEPDVALRIRLDVTDTILHPHSGCAHRNQATSLLIEDVESLTVAHIEFATASQDGLSLAYLLMDLAKLTLALPFLEDTSPRSYIDGMVFALTDVIDIVSITSHLESDDTLAIIQTHAIASRHPHTSLIVGHDT